MSSDLLEPHEPPSPCHLRETYICNYAGIRQKCISSRNETESQRTNGVESKVPRSAPTRSAVSYQAASDPKLSNSQHHVYQVRFLNFFFLNQSTDDAACSWVMLDGKGGFVPLPGEKVIHKSSPRIALAITTPTSCPGNNPLSIHSNSGIAYVTNQRVWIRTLRCQTFALTAYRSSIFLRSPLQNSNRFLHLCSTFTTLMSQCHGLAQTYGRQPFSQYPGATSRRLKQISRLS